MLLTSSLETEKNKFHEHGNLILHPQTHHTVIVCIFVFKFDLPKSSSYGGFVFACVIYLYIFYIFSY